VIMRFKVGDWVIMDPGRAHHFIKKGHPVDILDAVRVVSIREHEDKDLYDGTEVITVIYTAGHTGEWLGSYFEWVGME